MRFDVGPVWFGTKARAKGQADAPIGVNVQVLAQAVVVRGLRHQHLNHLNVTGAAHDMQVRQVHQCTGPMMRRYLNAPGLAQGHCLEATGDARMVKKFQTPAATVLGAPGLGPGAAAAHAGLSGGGRAGHRALRHQERRQDKGGEQGRDEKAGPALTRCGRCVCTDLCRSGSGSAEGAPYAAGFLAGDSDLSGGAHAVEMPIRSQAR